MIHTIPVPIGWSPEQAWEAIKREEILPDKKKTWVNIETDDEDNLVTILYKDDKKC